MLKRVLIGALLLIAPACTSADAPVETVPEGPGKVLVIGDSISLGLGAMGATTDCPVTPEYSSLRGTYGVQIADTLGVDHEVLAWPGIGLVRNFGEDQTNTLSARLGRPDLKQRLDAARPVQLVLVNIGTHDFFGNDATDAFVPAMEDLLSLLSKRYPDATIYALTGPMLSGTDKAFHDNAVQIAVDAVNAAQDTQIRFLALNGGDPKVAHGCAWHPSIPAHEHMAAMILEDMTARN